MDESTDKSQAQGDAPKADAHAEAKPESNTVMGILAYIGPLILVSYLVAKDDPFVKFHIKQGLLLVIGEVASWMIAMLFWPFFPISQIINVILLVLSIVGIIRAAHGEMRELPFIGKYAERFSI